MIEQLLNNCLLHFIHKKLTDLIKVARYFCAVSDECRKHFGAFK